MTIRGSQNALARLAQLQIEHRVMDLNLDEIFEAYVGGKKQHQTEITDQDSLPVEPTEV